MPRTASTTTSAAATDDRTRLVDLQRAQQQHPLARGRGDRPAVALRDRLARSLRGARRARRG